MSLIDIISFSVKLHYKINLVYIEIDTFEEKLEAITKLYLHIFNWKTLTAFQK